MTKLIVIILLVCLPALGFADDPAPVEVPDIQVHDINGKKYDCFLPVDAQVLLQLRINYPILKLDLDKHKELIVIKDIELKKLDDINANLAQQRDTYKDESIRFQEELKSRDAWYRNPYLWFTVGLVTGAGIAVGVAFAVN